MFCSSCGYDNPREYLYCGMCGTPFPHRPLTVPDAQSTLTFASAPLEIKPSPLPVHPAETPQPEPPPQSAAAEEVLVPQAPPQEAAPAAVAQPASPLSQPVELPSIPVVPPAIVTSAPPMIEPELPAPPPAIEPAVIERTHAEDVAEPEAVPATIPVESSPALPSPEHQESAPASEAPSPVIAATSDLPVEPDMVPSSSQTLTPPPVEPEAVPATIPVETSPSLPSPEHREPAPAPEAPTSVIRATSDLPVEPDMVPSSSQTLTPPPVEPEAVPATIPVEISPSRPSPEHQESAPAPEAPTPVIAATPELPVDMVPPSSQALTAPPIEAKPAQPVPRGEEVSRPTPAEVRDLTPPLREILPARIATGVRRPSIVERPITQPPIESPPANAGMPTFKSVAEAAGAPAISPFEPPEVKGTDDERELQEFVASFRYTPPDESKDELTMRSEVPVIDAEAPATPRHPSFDDDVPPPPEAGSHPTGEEYYPTIGPSTGRSRFLDISDTRQAASSHQVPPGLGSTFLGHGDPPTGATPLLDEAEPPSRNRWLLGTSLAALVAIFGSLGFLEGRAQIDHSYRGPVEIVWQQYAKLRQRVLTSRAIAPAAPSTAPVETTKTAEPPAEPSTSDQASAKTQSEDAANANPLTTSTAPPAPTAAQRPPQANPQSAPPADSIPAAANPADTAVKPDTTKAAAKPIEPPAPKPRSTHEPGQQEVSEAMQASDPTAAVAWLWKATSRGNSEAPVLLADMYVKGKGVPRSCEQALVLLRSASLKENAFARNRLAALYANGTCVARDRVKAYQLMSSALVADPGSDWARQTREDLWQQMTPEERVQAQKYR